MDKEDLTNEKLSKRFTNQFELVNYAINLADNMIKSGRSPRVKVDVDNPVIQVLAEIEEGKDYLEDIADMIQAVEEEEPPLRLDLNGKEKGKSHSFSKTGEKRKSRIMQA